MPPRSASEGLLVVGLQVVRDDADDVRLEDDGRSVARPMRRRGRFRYLRAVGRLQRLVDRGRSFNRIAVDGVLAVIFTVVGVASAYDQEILEGMREPSLLFVVAAIVTCAPIAF